MSELVMPSGNPNFKAEQIKTTQRQNPPEIVGRSIDDQLAKTRDRILDWISSKRTKTEQFIEVVKSNKEVRKEITTTLVENTATYGAGFLASKAVAVGAATTLGALPAAAIGAATLSTIVGAHQEHNRLYQTKTISQEDGKTTKEEVLKKNAARNLMRYYLQGTYETKQATTLGGHLYKWGERLYHWNRTSFGLLQKNYLHATGSKQYEKQVDQLDQKLNAHTIEQYKNTLAEQVQQGNITTEDLKHEEQHLVAEIQTASYAVLTARNKTERKQAQQVVAKYYELLKTTSQYTNTDTKALIKQLTTQRNEELTENVLKGTKTAHIARAAGAILKTLTGTIIFEAKDHIDFVKEGFAGLTQHIPETPPVHAAERPMQVPNLSHSDSKSFHDSIYADAHTNPYKHIADTDKVTLNTPPADTIPPKAGTEIGISEYVSTKRIDILTPEEMAKLPGDHNKYDDLFHAMKRNGLIDTQFSGSGKTFYDLVDTGEWRAKLPPDVYEKLQKIISENPNIKADDLRKEFGWQEFDKHFMVRPGKIEITIKEIKIDGYESTHGTSPVMSDAHDRIAKAVVDQKYTPRRNFISGNFIPQAVPEDGQPLITKASWDIKTPFTDAHDRHPDMLKTHLDTVVSPTTRTTPTLTPTVNVDQMSPTPGHQEAPKGARFTLQNPSSTPNTESNVSIEPTANTAPTPAPENTSEAAVTDVPNQPVPDTSDKPGHASPVPTLDRPSSTIPPESPVPPTEAPSNTAVPATATPNTANSPTPLPESTKAPTHVPPSPTPHEAPKPSNTPTPYASATPEIPTPPPTNTATPSPSATLEATVTPTTPPPTETVPPTMTATSTPEASVTPTKTVTPTIRPTNTALPSATPTGTELPSPTITNTPVPTGTETVPTQTPKPTNTPTPPVPTRVPENTPTSTPYPTAQPTETLQPTPTAKPGMAPMPNTAGEPSLLDYSNETDGYYYNTDHSIRRIDIRPVDANAVKVAWKDGLISAQDLGNNSDAWLIHSLNEKYYQKLIELRYSKSEALMITKNQGNLETIKALKDALIYNMYPDQAQINQINQAIAHLYTEIPQGFTEPKNIGVDAISDVNKTILHAFKTNTIVSFQMDNGSIAVIDPKDIVLEYSNSSSRQTLGSMAVETGHSMMICVGSGENFRLLGKVRELTAEEFAKLYPEQIPATTIR